MGSPQYGQYEPIATLSRRFGASAADRSRVLHYLHGAGATHVKIDVTGLFADATMTVSQAQRLFGTSLGALSGRASGPLHRSDRRDADPGRARRRRDRGGRARHAAGVRCPAGDRRFARRRGHADGGRRLQSLPAHPRDGLEGQPVSGYSERTGTATGCADAIADHGFTPNQYLTAYDYASLQSAGIRGSGERVALIEIDGFK